MTPEDQVKEGDRAAREMLQALIRDGRAVEVVNAYSEHTQACSYVRDIVTDVAGQADGTFGGPAESFARNILEDWSK